MPLSIHRRRHAWPLLALFLLFTAAGPRWCEGADAPDGYTHNSWTDFGEILQPPGVYAITQDRVGYLWVGSLGGMLRFDGQRFARWETLGRPALPQRPVTALLTTRDGTLWMGFGNLGGVSRYRKDALRHYPPQDGVPEGAIRQFLETRDGTIWASGFGGLARFRGERWERIGAAHGLPETAPDLVHEDPAGHLWVAAQAVAFRFDPARDRFSPVAGASSLTPFGEAVARAVPAPVVNGAFARLNPSALPAVLLGRNGFFWIGTSTGLLRVKAPAGGTSEALRIDTTTRLTSDNITALFEDREGNVWIGTANGLDALLTRRTGPVSMRLTGHTVLAVTVGPHGHVWTGTADGLHESGPSGGRWYDRRDGLPGLLITALHPTHQTLWVATDGGLARLVGDRFVPVLSAGGPRFNRIISMTADADGGLWISDLAGLHRLKDNALTDIGAGTPIAGRRTSVVYMDRRGVIWVGFWGGGVAAYEQGRFRVYETGHGLSAGRVSVIREDAAGRLWVGTLNGFSRLDGDRFTTLGEASGLANLMVAALIDDTSGALWLATFSGLLRLQPEEFDRAARDPSYRPQYVLFGSADGKRNSFPLSGYPSATRTSQGLLAFAKLGGLAEVMPTNIPERPGPPVLVEQVTVDDHVLRPSGTIELPSQTSRVQIDYTALTFVAPPRFEFRYMLEGFDQDWVHAGSARRAVYTNLPPRQYRFRVAASHDGSQWQEATAPLSLTVMPALYQQVWFGPTLAVAVLLVVILLWRLRLRGVQREYTLVLAERTRLGREIHDTLLQGMVGVALQLHGLSESLDASSTVMKDRLDRAREFLEHYIRETRLSIWDLRSSSLERRDLAAALREAGAAVTEGSSVALEVTVHGKPRPCDPRVDEHLLRIAHEAMANAIRHGRASHIHVDLSYDADAVRLAVRDDGQGFDPTEVAHRSGRQWGLTTMRERAQQIGASFRCSSGTTGTVIEAIATVPAGR